ncbi:MAG: ribose-phosphate diphosphokinase [Gammaproteobacteria bacterium]|nr:ribose-phosphate diphosphokinase [Gammaproteobacteria bacterium]
MQPSSRQQIILGMPSYREPAQRLAAAAGCAYADIDVHTFPDGESRVRLPAQLPEEVVICVSLDRPNDKLVALELAAATARELGAGRVVLVAPYLCYMRQDRAFVPGEAVSQHVIGHALARHFDTVITVDPHLHRVHRLDQAVPVRRAVALTAASLMTDWLGTNANAPLLLGPDAESAQWVSAIATPAGLEFGVAHKQRLGDRDVRITLPSLAFAGRHVVVVDDVASSGQTLLEATRLLVAAGAVEITVLVTHALFVGDAEQRLRAAGVSGICSTDSVVHPSNRIALAPLLAQALSEP